MHERQPAAAAGPSTLTARPRRNRRTPAIRGLLRETRLHVDQLIYPLFVQEGGDEPIDAMPGLWRWGVNGAANPDDAAGLIGHVEQAMALGVRAVALFPRVEADRKTPDAREALNARGVIPRTVAMLKSRLGDDLWVITDVALDPYNSHGHDGLVCESGRVHNDATVTVLVEQALTQAAAGADMVAPSDMMDGRVGAIRRGLDAAGFTDVGILSYAAKYASAFYGPFRAALESAPRAEADRPIPADKKTYQMDPANAREALREVALDEAEGADMVMVKPAGLYLDVIQRVRQATTLPLAAYQVSGEYLMIKAAAAAGHLDEQQAVLESLLGIVRAGADSVLTYFALDAARWIGR